MTKTVVSIRKTHPVYDVWRITYDGKLLGDSRGYSRPEALSEACKIVAQHPKLYELGELPNV
jgi:hypothetical protein